MNTYTVKNYCSAVIFLLLCSKVFTAMHTNYMLLINIGIWIKNSNRR
jgi:uncharacterized membrane protein